MVPWLVYMEAFFHHLNFFFYHQTILRILPYELVIASYKVRIVQNKFAMARYVVKFRIFFSEKKRNYVI